MDYQRHLGSKIPEKEPIVISFMQSICLPVYLTQGRESSSRERLGRHSSLLPAYGILPPPHLRLLKYSTPKSRTHKPKEADPYILRLPMCHAKEPVERLSPRLKNALLLSFTQYPLLVQKLRSSREKNTLPNHPCVKALIESPIPHL